IDKKRVEQERIKREAESAISTAHDEIAAIKAGGAVATDAAIAEARGERDEHWRPIRSAFVEGRVEGDSGARLAAVATFEAGILDSDALADRRAEEAERVASLQGYEREVARARLKVSAADAELEALAAECAAREQAFAAPYPELTKRGLSLGALLEFTTRRKEMIGLAATTREQADAIAVDAAQLAPTIELMEDAERKLSLEARGALAGRVQAFRLRL